MCLAVLTLSFVGEMENGIYDEGKVAERRRKQYESTTIRPFSREQEIDHFVLSFTILRSLNPIHAAGLDPLSLVVKFTNE